MSHAICRRNSADEANLLSSAEFFADFNLQFRAVKSAVEIEQMRFHAKLRFGGSDCRAQTDVERDAIKLSLQFCAAGINSIRRKNQICRIKICRRKTKFVAELVTFNHSS